MTKEQAFYFDIAIDSISGLIAMGIVWLLMMTPSFLIFGW